MSAAIQAISYYLPPRVLSNADLNEEFPEWSVDKIAEKTGILERHIADEDICASDLGVESALRLFREHDVDPAGIDFLMLCTQSPDYFLPTTACLMQDRLGIPTSAGALDFNLGCSGFVYGLSLARGLIESEAARNVLLITAETYSKFIHPRDKSVRTIFGDGAAATLIAGDSGRRGIGPFVFGTDGRGGPNLIVPTGGMRRHRTGLAKDFDDGEGNTRNDDSLFMNGGEIFQFTLQRIPRLVDELLEKAGLAKGDIDLYVFHQANAFMLDALRKKLKLPQERFYASMAHCANTVSATIPIALADAISMGRLEAGSRAMLVGFGVGYSWAGCIAHF
ncbi:MAG: 3-oxoacyl-[acyl-carrier-protein] synthase [Thermoanaerobaculia bacterium]|nr:3-oxoacyl-[acyl-carrier-protein] synthase [Thermoanaerobaculia bacterium]